MALTTLKRSPGGETGFPLLLKTWRQKRRLSQLDLALSSGVSQRHVSFLESGRANPSRSMILKLSETLDVTADELRIESLFPADAATEALFQAAAGQ